MSSEVTISGAAVPERTPQMAWQRVDGELVLLAIDRGELIGLNAVAARVWELIDDARDVATITATLVAEFDVEGAIVERDVTHFLRELVERGAVSLRVTP